MIRVRAIAVGLVLLMPLCPSALRAQASPAPRRVQQFSTATLEHLADSLSAARIPSTLLGAGAAYQYVLARRDVTGQPEQHARWMDVMVVQSGSATLVSGGRIDEAYAVSDGEMRGRGIIGGESRRVAAGDVVAIPSGLPHQMQLGPGESIRYVTVKVSDTAERR
jgi:mannose-6-phosphate isomerase-like protein (cupin superfamily)